MGGGWKSIKNFFNVLMNKRMRFDIVAKLIELFFIRKLTKNQKVRYFQEVRFFRQLFDGIAAVTKYSFIAIQESNTTFGSARIFIA